MAVVVLYLAAAAVSNIAVTRYGYAALPFTAVLLIPFDLTTRDVLHDRWHGDRLVLRMAALVVGGASLAWVFASGSPRVCIASAVSFAIAGAVDTCVYATVPNVSQWQRMTLSNTASAIADSVCFPLLAFGMVSVPLAMVQSVMKILGGVAWAALITWHRQR